jgi:hypothetical protein
MQVKIMAKMEAIQKAATTAPIPTRIFLWIPGENILKHVAMIENFVNDIEVVYAR